MVESKRPKTFTWRVTGFRGSGSASTLPALKSCPPGVGVGAGALIKMSKSSSAFETHLSSFVFEHLADSTTPFD